MPRKLYEFPPMLEPAEDFPVGSIEWAERMSNRLQLGARSLSRSTSNQLRDQILAICSAQPSPWVIWPKDRPFGTPQDYCEAVTGHAWEWLLATVIELTGDKSLGDLIGRKLEVTNARAQAESRGQGTRTDQLLSDATKLNDRGSGYLLRRLARTNPDILDRYENGEFKSARAAARAAGIVKDPTPFQQVQKLLPKLTATEKRKLKEMLG